MSLTIEAAKAESVRIQHLLIEQIPDDQKSADKLPAPGSVRRTPMPCNGGGHFYPGGAVVRLSDERVDAAGIVASLRSYLSAQGWKEQPVPTEDRPDRVMHTNADGYEVIVSWINRSDDLPMVTINVYSPCAELPEGVNPFSYKI